MIQIGTEHFHSTAVGTSIAFTAFALCLIVAALECRSETDSILTTATFESRQMNRTMLLEFVLAVLTTQMDALRRILGTTELTFREFTWALVPAVGLFLLWELGKLLARRLAGASTPPGHSRPGGRRVSGRLCAGTDPPGTAAAIDIPIGLTAMDRSILATYTANVTPSPYRLSL